MGGWWWGRMGAVMVLGQGGPSSSQNGTVRRAGKKRHDGGPLDWPGSAGARSSARKLKSPPCTSSGGISCSVCVPESAAREPAPEQYVGASPTPGSRWVAGRTGSQAMKPALVLGVCPGQTGGWGEEEGGYGDTGSGWAAGGWGAVYMKTGFSKSGPILSRFSFAMTPKPYIFRKLGEKV